MTDGRFDPRGEPTKCDRFSVGALKGWEMALENLQTMGWPGQFRQGQYVRITCTRVEPAREANQSDMPYFNVDVQDEPFAEEETGASY